MAWKENIKRKRQVKNKNIEWINELTFGHIARFWVPTFDDIDEEKYSDEERMYSYYWEYTANGDEDIIYGRFTVDLNKNTTSKPLLERFADFIESNKGKEYEGIDFYTDYVLFIEVVWNVCGDKTWDIFTGNFDEDDGPELTDDECQLLISKAYEKFKPEFDNFKKNHKDIWYLMTHDYYYYYKDAKEEIENIKAKGV